ncbi:phosphonate metabolism protein/1,5-bisphosphokinase (PRPP-forming) PhnN [Roseomonas xinghualingensis]|uniref:phosphonate metabolism protein/1,5-bisphosphokinase (PRPP-forming) PhnN n=1 Tax=Roseomonas xinghualingensis TaxID=2986475 RepID=UPI0021F0B0A1|nr:phosphonate metabolism protein/1,5-bisphosphokinase (PRPP-forming) PhnN [Roseomonas sp. SXEYE001]MCV4206300.1 phosphonate metabolism protein/1,5-bisphosphokinase (PRPP-forming) PhnN [Roseomonas sp. SXEYE001]
MTGRLIAVVGPSGAGKDTLMEAAREELRGDPAFVFLRRVITRPAGAGGEDHMAVTEEGFAAMRDAGGLALWWQAHGLLYGLPRAPLEAPLAAGQVVVANLSRQALSEAALRYPLRVLEITAPLELRAARLAARGRETVEDVMRRLGRQAPLPPGLDVRQVTNDASLPEGVAQVLAGLRAG